MFEPTTLPDTRNATFSLVSVDGRSPPASPAGQTIASCGRVPRRASRSASRVKAKPKLTIGTCGPTFFASSTPDGPLSSWENRLRRRLARTGSTECSLTWKASVTPAGRSLSRLVPSMRPTEETAYGLWPTATAQDSESAGGAGCIASGKRGHSLTSLARALWATPTSLAPAKDGNNEAGNSAGLVSIRAHAVALWQTAVADDAVNRERGKYNSRGEPKLSAEVKLVPHGMAPDGSSATTGKPGALNPEFVCWLMGFLPAWDACAPTVMPSSRRSRRK